MIRFILFLLGKTGYEICPSCEILKQQLEYERQNNKELMDSLLNLVKPKVKEIEQPSTPINPIRRVSMPFEQRRRILEANKRAELHELKKSHPGAGERIDALERELGIVNKKEDMKDAG